MSSKCFKNKFHVMNKLLYYLQEWRSPGYTVELDKGVNPLPLSQFDEIYQESLDIMLAGLSM
jgi:g-D-glutamyl-meso-diaminopimelate peptidase